MLTVCIDHIVISVPELDVAQESFRTRYGLEVTGGGRHEGVGTENRIIPLDGSYLELVTVVDAAEAAGNPFGRLVTFGLEQRVPLTAWVVTGGDTQTAGLSHQHLRRDGVAVDLYGVDEVVDAGDRPFGLVRPADQAIPGAGAAGGTRLFDVQVVRPGLAGPVSVTNANAALPRGIANRGGRLSAVVLEQPDGTRMTLDQHLLEVISR
ncbi:VOC family protein [Gordonia paraffinivorans]|uniref:VOC family protein n=1 Tax=Gordonia paraffinivorans TaxID=175628 RepID=UPI001446769D|nr:VOC family protein [Gordonia paraffinivorans]